MKRILMLMVLLNPLMELSLFQPLSLPAALGHQDECLVPQRLPGIGGIVTASSHSIYVAGVCPACLGALETSDTKL